MSDAKLNDIERAIIGLSELAKTMEPFLLKTNYEGLGEEDVKELKYHIKLSVKALKKQTPYKLEDVDLTYIGEKMGTCKCGNQSVLEHQKHCIDCGQLVKW